MEPIKVGLLGFGTVGSGTFTVLRRNQEEIKRRAGRGIEIARIAVRNPAKATAALGTEAGTVRSPITSPQWSTIRPSTSSSK
jgi:homoserine dehydrogenase